MVGCGACLAPVRCHVYTVEPMLSNSAYGEAMLNTSKEALITF